MGAKDIFERLARERPTQQTKEPIEQQRKDANRVARGIQETNAKTFLMDALANGPVPAAIIEELGRAREFDKSILWRAKQRISAGSFKSKGKGKWCGCWYWVLSPRTPDRVTATKSDERHIRRLLALSKALGYRLRPIDKYPEAVKAPGQ